MPYIFYSALIIAIYFSIGIGLAVLILPRAVSRLSIFIAPFVGICAIQLIGWYIYVLNIKGTDSYAKYLLVVMIVGNLVLLLFRKLRNRLTFKVSEISLVYLIGYLGFLCVSLTVFLQPSSLTTVSFGNNDIAYVSSISTFLKEYSRFDSVGFLGQNDVFKGMADFSLFGGPFVVAFLCSVLNLQVYQIQTMHLAVLFFLLIPLVYACASELFKYSESSAYLLEAFFALNPIIHYIVLCGFQGQLLTTGIAFCLIIISLSAFFHSRCFRDYLKYTGAFTLFSWGLCSSYGHMLTITYGVLFVAVACNCLLVNKDVRPLLHWSGFVLVGVVLLALLSIHRARAFVMLTFYAGVIQAGWFIRLLTPAAFFGFDPKPLFVGNARFVWYRELLPAGICLMALAGYRRSFRDARALAVTGLSVLCIVGLGYLMLAYSGRTDSGWGGYKSFKLLSFFLPQLVACSFVGIDSISIRVKGEAFKVSMIIFPLIIIPCVISVFSSMKHYKTSYSVQSNLTDIQSVGSRADVDSVNILGADYWQIMWSVNLLLPKRLFFEVSSYGGLIASELKGDWDLVPTCLFTAPLAPYEYGDDVMHINDQYVLMKHSRYVRDSNLTHLDERAYRAAIGFDGGDVEWKPGQCREVQVQVANASPMQWPPFCRWPESRISLSYRWRDGNHKVVGISGAPTPLVAGLKSGERVAIKSRVCSPVEPGAYLLEFDLGHNGVWFEEMGSEARAVHVTVR